MDFKVAGTEKGVTALQMDIKIAGVSIDIMREALQQAREARMIVLARCARPSRSRAPSSRPYAPRFVTIKIRPEKIREIIGPGGKVIRGIQEQTGTKIDVEDDGRVTVFSPDSASVQKALGMIQDICREVELDRIYLGKVKKIVEFGAFVEVIPNTEGLLHISQIAESRIRTVQDVLTEGDEVLVKVIEVDGNGKMRLSRKMALRDQPALADKERLKNPQARQPPSVTERLSQERFCPTASASSRSACRTCARSRSACGSRPAPATRSRTAAAISHLIEHLVFKGTATRSAEAIARTMDSVGGQMDAFTTKEHTCFYVQVLDEHLPLAVDLLTDILLHPLFDAEELEREKSVVLQEIRMVEDTPDDIIHDLFAAQIWGGHPLARPILGTRELVTGFHRDAIAELLRARSTCRRGSSSRWPATSLTSRWWSCSARASTATTRPARPRASDGRPAGARREHRPQGARAGAPGDGIPRAWPTPRPSATRCSCSTTSSAAACPRGCSRRCGSGRGWRTRCTPACRPSSTPGSCTSTRPPTRRTSPRC